MNSIPAVLLVAIVLLSGCAAQPSEPAIEHAHVEIVKLECTRTLNVQTNESGARIQWWDTKCRETSKELLPQ